MNDESIHHSSFAIHHSIPMDRSNPYEAAFEAYVKASGLCYVAVDETRRSVLGDTPVKNLDFIVLGLSGARLLVDVKGRQFPGGPAERPRYTWENWSTQDDIDGLSQWSALFGPDYLALFVFMYRILPTITLQDEPPDLWRHRDETYLLRAVPLVDYRRHLRVRSPKWRTVGLPTARFRELARPFRYYTHECPSATGEALPDGPDQARHLAEVAALALAARPSGRPQDWRARG
jgi:hypothetical protein